MMDILYLRGRHDVWFVREWVDFSIITYNSKSRHAEIDNIWNSLEKNTVAKFECRKICLILARHQGSEYFHRKIEMKHEFHERLLFNFVHLESLNSKYHKSMTSCDEMQ